MKTIKFSEKELGFIRQQYQVELEEAEEYVENLKTILKKISSAELTAGEEANSVPKRRGPKPKVKAATAGTPAEMPETKRKPRSDKGVKRPKKGKTITDETVVTDSATPPVTSEEAEKSDETEKKVLPKKKVKKQAKRRRGVFLPPMRKPL